MRAFDPKNHRPADSYPMLWHEIVRQGKGVLTYTDYRWTKDSLYNRFRRFIKTLRQSKLHALHSRAMEGEWAMSGDWDGWHITLEPKELAKKT